MDILLLNSNIYDNMNTYNEKFEYLANQIMNKHILYINNNGIKLVN